MDEVLISVIIPIYNGERYIQRSVDSVLCQLNEQIELILVDDGSTDRCGELCDAYAKKGAHVRVVHKKNGGLSSARNAGVAAARGEYVLFLDVDDYLERNACEEICEVIRAWKPDCIDYGWNYISEEGEVTSNQHKIPKNRLLDEEVLKDDILPPLLNLRSDPEHFIYDFACTKVFRRDIIQANSVAFDENRRVWEDRPFVVQYLKFCSNFYSMDRCFYNYVGVPGSLSRRYSMEFFRIIIENYHHYKRLYGDVYDFDTQYVYNYWSKAIENMIFRSLGETENREQVKRNILKALSHEQVVYWYTMRKPENKFEHRISLLVSSGEYEQALCEYEYSWQKKQKKQINANLIGKVKRVAKKLLGE